MGDSKLVKAYCDKSKQYYALEVKKFGTKWKVVNMTYMSRDEAKILSTEVEQDSFETNTTLLPCLSCGSRRIGGCSCESRKHRCAPGMKYNFGCVYCNNFKIDYSLPTAADVGGRAGEKITLSQGQEVQIRLADNRPLKHIYVGVGWDPAYSGSDNMDVDSSVVVVSKNNSSHELVYYGHLDHSSGCVHHHGDNLTGVDRGTDDDENIDVYLDRVPASDDKLVFVLNIYSCDSRGQTLANVKNLYIKIYDPDSKQELIQYNVANSSGRDTCVVIGAAFRKNGGWSFKAIGRTLRCSTVSELAEECKRYI